MGGNIDVPGYSARGSSTQRTGILPSVRGRTLPVPAATVAADPGSRQGSRGDEAAEGTGGPVQHPILTPHDGGRGEYDGEALLNDVFDLMRRRLPHLRLDDPVRPTVAALLPHLAEALGRPAVALVQEARRRDAADHL